MTVFALAAMVHDVVVVCLRPVVIRLTLRHHKSSNRNSRWDMSRLNYMQGCELAIHTVAEELGFLERSLASGAKMASDDLQDLNSCLKQLQQILDGCQRQASSKWQEDSEPLPAWLQREQTSSNSKHEEGEEPGSAVAGHAYPRQVRRS